LKNEDETEEEKEERMEMKNDLVNLYKE